MKDSLTIFSPQGMLGYGYPLSSFERALTFDPDAIGVDAGSTDAGPYRLGSGKPTVSSQAVEKDLIPMLRAAKRRKIPLIIGSAGGAGARPHVDWLRSIIYKLAAEESLHFKIAVIYSDVDKDWLKEKLLQGEVKPLGLVPELTEAEIYASKHIVAVMGIEPYMEALDAGADIIIAGRSNDPAIFASFAIYHGFSYALSFHLGKILECGAIAAYPGTASDGMLGFLRKDHFIVEPSNEKRRCTKLSVASHSLYEKSHPFLIPGPEGVLDLRRASFEEVDGRRVRVAGALFHRADESWIKLEGAKAVGYRCIAICGVKDPIMVEKRDEWIEATRGAAMDYFGEEFTLYFKLLGGEGLIIDVVATTLEKAKAVCSWVRSYLMHYHYSGRKSTSGNLALPFSPSEIPVGEVYQFNVHHLVRVKEHESIFKIEFERL